MQWNQETNTMTFIEKTLDVVEFMTSGKFIYFIYNLYVVIVIK